MARVAAATATADAGRCHAADLTKSQGPVRLVVVRLHRGTHGCGKVARCRALWMRRPNAAPYRAGGPARPGLVLPGRTPGSASPPPAEREIVTPLRAQGVSLDPAFVRLPRARLRPTWEKVVPNWVGRLAAAGWYGWYDRARFGAAAASRH